MGVRYRKSINLGMGFRINLSSSGMQEIILHAKANDPRRNAGIKESIDTSKMKAGKTLPWFIKTNITPIVFTMKSTL